MSDRPRVTRTRIFLEAHGYRCSWRQYAARYRQHLRQGDPYPCNRGHRRCSLKAGGPCWRELMAMLARERPLDIVTIEEGRPRNHGVHWITFPHWHRHPICVEVYLHPNGTRWRVELRQQLRDCEAVVDAYEIDADRAGTQDPAASRQVLETWLNRYPAAVGDFLQEAPRALEQARAYTLALRRRLSSMGPGDLVDLNRLEPPACVRVRHAPSGRCTLPNRILGRRGLRLLPAPRRKHVIVERRLPGSEALVSLAW